MVITYPDYITDKSDKPMKYDFLILFHEEEAKLAEHLTEQLQKKVRVYS